MRPHGDICVALADAARDWQGPVRELAMRAQVGYAHARYTASRMIDRGQLLVLSTERPAVVTAAPAEGAHAQGPFDDLNRSFWERSPA